MLKRLVNSIVIVTFLIVALQAKQQSYKLSLNFDRGSDRNLYSDPKLGNCNYFDSEILVPKQGQLGKSILKEDSHPMNIPLENFEKNHSSSDFFVGICSSDKVEKN